MQLEYGTRIVRPGGIFIICASAADHLRSERPVEATLDELARCTVEWTRDTGAGDPVRRAHYRKRDVVCKEELMRLPLGDLSRIVTRRLGEPRSTTMAWSHRRCLETTRVFLVSEGITAEEGLAMGFSYVTDSFADALRRALDERGRDADIVANVVPRTEAGKPAYQTAIPYPAEHTIV
jgi:hypothetical protein